MSEYKYTASKVIQVLVSYFNEGSLFHEDAVVEYVDMERALKVFSVSPVTARVLENDMDLDSASLLLNMSKDEIRRVIFEDCELIADTLNRGVR